MGFMMGARSEDCLFIGELLGIRTFSLAVVAFPKLGPIMQVIINASLITRPFYSRNKK